MKKTLLAASAFLLCTMAIARAQQPTLTIENQQPYIEVTGTAQTRVTPNKIEMAINLNEADSKGKTSLAQMERALATALQEAGVDADSQLAVTDQSSVSQSRKTIYQYKSYLLTLSNGAEVASVFERLKANGIANASVVNTTRTDLLDLQKQLKIDAVKNAQENARDLAGAIGQTVGKAIYIQDFSTPVYPLYRAANASLKMEAAMDALADVDYQDIRIDQRVTVRFVLE